MSDTHWNRQVWIRPESLPEGFTHLSLPVCTAHPEGGYVLFATSRDPHQSSHVVAAEFKDLGALREDWQLNWRTVINPGRTGHFDESGVVLSDVWLDRASGEFVGYVFGWRLRMGGGWFNTIGCFRMDASLRVLEYGPTEHPRLDAFDPISVGYATRLRNSEDIFYCSTQLMNERTGAVDHYRVHQTNLSDLVKRVVADPLLISPEDSFAFSRPFGVKGKSGEHVWVSERGSQYSLRHLFRPTGAEFFEAGLELLNLEPSGLGGEQEATCYGSISKIDDEIFMFYNGDNFGMSGLGIAQLTDGVLD